MSETKKTITAGDEKNDKYLDDDPFETATAKGLLVVLPEQNQLQLDLDNPVEELPFLEKMIDVMERNGFIVEIERQTKSPGGKLHVTLNLFEETAKGTIPKVLAPSERIALQACLGSDRMRELLSICRIYRGIKPPTCFFEKAAP